jgi:hypothetical protein
VPKNWVFQQLAAGSVDATGGPDKHVRLHVVSCPRSWGWTPW